MVVLAGDEVCMAFSFIMEAYHVQSLVASSSRFSLELRHSFEGREREACLPLNQPKTFQILHYKGWKS